MVNFPSSLDDTTSLPDPGTGNFTDNPSHAGLHDLENAAIRAIEAKVGTGASTPSAGKVFRGTSNGVSSWGALDLTTDVTGILPVANGGTGLNSLAAGIATFLGAPSSANLLAAMTTKTGTGSLVFGTSPTLTTPIIGDFTNSNHAHSTVAQGGQLSFSALLSTIFSSQVTTYTNPGTAGGTNSFFYINLGGIKLFWGTTATVSISGTGIQASSPVGITYPAGFFTTVQSITPGVGTAPTGTGAVFATLQAVTSTTSIAVTLQQTTGTNGAAGISILAIGT